LNAFGKISEPAMGAWGKILREAPGSRILLHAGEGAHRRRCVERFEKKGIAAERIGFVGFVPMEKYFAIYDQIDIGLDPFPYCGGTTTCDALWMGVPVITLSGRTAVGRVGHSILSNVGLAQFVAASIDEYVEKAVDLAANIALREELGRGLRKKMKHSVLMDGGRFARDVEGAYRLAWGQWANRGG
jgi:protein O-GlcNAc transferase